MLSKTRWGVWLFNLFPQTESLHLIMRIVKVHQDDAFIQLDIVGEKKMTIPHVWWENKSKKKKYFSPRIFFIYLLFFLNVKFFLGRIHILFFMTCFAVSEQFFFLLAPRYLFRRLKSTVIDFWDKVEYEIAMAEKFLANQRRLGRLSNEFGNFF